MSNMKKLFYVAAIFSLAIVYAFKYPSVDFTNDAEEGIQFFRGSWDEALELAKEEDKLIFLDIYASWCGPCKALKKNTFSDEKVGVFYNDNFINVTVDGEKGEGPKLTQRYGIQGYPSLLFIDAHGQLVGGTAGYHNPGQFLSLGKKALK